MKAALVSGGEFHDWDESMGRFAGEGVQSPSSPIKSSVLPTRTAHGFSEEQERNHGAVLEMPAGTVPNQGDGKHKVVVGRMQEGSQGTFKLQGSLGSCRSHRLGDQC